MHRETFTQRPLHTQNHFPVVVCSTNLAQSTSQYYFVHKPCTRHFPVLLRTTRLSQNTSQYYFVLQEIHKIFPNTTLYYKACTRQFPVLLCTRKLAANTSQYYFALQAVHKTLPSFSSYKPGCIHTWQHNMATQHGNTTWQHNMATQHGNNHATIPVRPATMQWLWHKGAILHCPMQRSCSHYKATSLSQHFSKSTLL